MSKFGKYNWKDQPKKRKTEFLPKQEYFKEPDNKDTPLDYSALTKTMSKLNLNHSNVNSHVMNTNMRASFIPEASIPKQPSLNQLKTTQASLLLVNISAEVIVHDSIDPEPSEFLVKIDQNRKISDLIKVCIAKLEKQYGKLEPRNCNLFFKSRILDHELPVNGYGLENGSSLLFMATVTNQDSGQRVAIKKSQPEDPPKERVSFENG